MLTNEHTHPTDANGTLDNDPYRQWEMIHIDRESNYPTPSLKRTMQTMKTDTKGLWEVAIASLGDSLGHRLQVDQVCGDG